MVTTIIGKIFLQAYNKKFCEKNGKELTPKEFFTDIFYPLFFGHDKYLMWIQNSEMVQGLKKGATLTSEEIERRKNRCIEKIENAIVLDASIAVGYRAESLCASTSGQIGLHELKNTPDDAYLSWIGAGLGVGIQGGLSVLFDNPEVLLDLYDGWGVYRKLINELPEMKGNQITTWNGQWLKKKCSPYDDVNDFSSVLENEDKVISIGTIPWAELLIAISRHFTYPQMMGYIYSLGQTYTTIGFIPFALSPIRRPYELYIKYFGVDECEYAIKLFGTAMGLATACREGVIGLKALEPKGLMPMIKGGKIPSVKFENEEQKIKYNTYQIWLLAMLNNEELWQKAKEFAESLQHYSITGKSARTGRSNSVKNLLESINKKGFIEQLIPIISDAENVHAFEEIAALINGMPSDNVPYFLTLMRFHYAFINNQSNLKTK